MPSTFLSPRGKPILGTNTGIIFPPMSEWEEVDLKVARLKLSDPNAPWSPDMAGAVAAWRNGARDINLVPNGQARIGIAIALLLQDDDGKLAPVFSQFDDTHPTRPLKLTPPAGVLGGRDILKDGLGELGQEMIPTIPGEPTRVGHWLYQDPLLGTEQILEPEWVKNFAETKKFEIDEDLLIPVSQIYDSRFKLTNFLFSKPGNLEQLVSGWLANEFDTGSFEIMIPVIAKLPKGVVLQDGEILPNGNFRNSKVIPMFLTDKAEVIMRAVLKIKNS